MEFPLREGGFGTGGSASTTSKEELKNYPGVGKGKKEKTGESGQKKKEGQKETTGRKERGAAPLPMGFENQCPRSEESEENPTREIEKKNKKGVRLPIRTNCLPYANGGHLKRKRAVERPWPTPKKKGGQ